MPVIRVTKNNDFTVVDNRYLKDTGLSLRSKGLLTQLLSLPDTWVYSISGLARLNRDGEDSIRAGIRELERAGYITRTPRRNADGRFHGYEYVIHERPIAPTLEHPSPETPTAECPSPENHPQSNINRSNMKKSSIHPSIIQSDQTWDEKGDRAERSGTELEICRREIMENISYEMLCQEYPFCQTEVAELLEIIVETLCSESETIRAGRKDYPAELVKQRLRALNTDHLRYVMDCMRKNTTHVKNIKQYILTALFNAPATIDNHYAAMVSHDNAHSA